LSNEEVEQLLDVKDCIDVLEDAYREQAAGRAISQLRMDTEVPCGSLLCAKAPHPKASRLFIDFFLSGETQKLLVGMNRVPARSDVKPKNPKLDPVKLKITVITPEMSEKFDRYSQEFREIFLNGR
jgi:hypothetical protein